MKKKLAVRARYEEDGRIRNVRLTEAGVRLISHIEEELGAMLAEALSEFDTKVIAVLPEVLRALTSALNCGFPNQQLIPAASIRRL